MAPAGQANADVSKKLQKHPIIILAFKKKTDILN